MPDLTRSVRRKPCDGVILPPYVLHRDFTRKNAAERYASEALLAESTEYDGGHMPDEVTKTHSVRMHFAAHRVHLADNARDRRFWMDRYIALRDRIVLGNRKLIYRAVQRHSRRVNQPDDLIGDCHIVFIQAVAVFNPWLGIRFSTYAYTCLIRALARQSRKACLDWLERAVPFDSLPEHEPFGRFALESSGANELPLEEYLRAGHPLLSDREKAILSRRFCFAPVSGAPTLERVGRAVGLSKERVRQVQSQAIEKLRQSLLAGSHQ